MNLIIKVHLNSVLFLLQKCFFIIDKIDFE